MERKKKLSKKISDKVRGKQYQGPDSGHVRQEPIHRVHDQRYRNATFPYIKASETSTHSRNVAWSTDARLTAYTAEAQLRQNVANFNNDFDNLLLHTGDYLSMSKEKQAKRAGAFNKWYNTNMMLMCLRPFEEGVGLSACLQAVGMYAGICMIDKDFRNEVRGKLGGTLAKTCDNFQDALENGQLGKGSKMIARFFAKPSVKHLAENWQRSDNFGEIPMDPRTAGMQLLMIDRMGASAMAENNATIARLNQKVREMHELMAKWNKKYDEAKQNHDEVGCLQAEHGKIGCEDTIKDAEEKLRAVQLERESIRGKYEKAIGNMEEICQAQGLSMEEVHKQKRIVLGQCMQVQARDEYGYTGDILRRDTPADCRYSNIAQTFMSGMYGYDDVQKHPIHGYHKEEHLHRDKKGNVTKQMRDVWDGEFDDLTKEDGTGVSHYNEDEKFVSGMDDGGCRVDMASTNEFMKRVVEDMRPPCMDSKEATAFQQFYAGMQGMDMMIRSAEVALQGDYKGAGELRDMAARYGARTEQSAAQVQAISAGLSRIGVMQKHQPELSKDMLKTLYIVKKDYMEQMFKEHPGWKDLGLKQYMEDCENYPDFRNVDNNYYANGWHKQRDAWDKEWEAIQERKAQQEKEAESESKAEPEQPNVAKETDVTEQPGVEME